MLQRLASDASLTQLDECDPHWWTLSAAYFGRVHSIWELLGEHSLDALGQAVAQPLHFVVAL